MDDIKSTKINSNFISNHAKYNYFVQSGPENFTKFLMKYLMRIESFNKFHFIDPISQDTIFYLISI